MLLQRQSPSLRPLTTAHLAQTMTLMALTANELRQRIEAELASNPALEAVETRRCPHCRRPLGANSPCPFCTRPAAAGPDQPIVFLSPREDFYSIPGGFPVDDLPGDNQAIETEDLPQYVLRQIAADLQTEDRALAAHLLTCLNDDGLLETPLEEIARYHHVPISRLEAVKRIIQLAEPVGVGSRTPQEALLIQIEVLSAHRPVPANAAQAITFGLDLLSRHRYPELARLMGMTTAEAKEIAQFIAANLNPFPARAHWGDQRQIPTPATEAYHQPDAIITRMNQSTDTPLIVEVAAPLAGALRINPLFQEAIRDAPQEKAEKWQEDLEKATLLVKCVQQRNHTIVRLLQRLAVLQRAYILHGDAHIQPLTRAELALELAVHESTISRAVANKAVQLPNGRIVPLSIFFDRSLHVRTALRQIIEHDGAVLSDTEIAARLASQGYPIARRTVAKYRAIEGILPAHLRHTSAGSR